MENFEKKKVSCRKNEKAGSKHGSDNTEWTDYKTVFRKPVCFDKMLRQSGLFDQLEEMGIQDGDTVDIYDIEFEYQR
mgnify:CR=1 FL=1